MVNVAGASAGGASVSPGPGGPVGVVDYAGRGGIDWHVEISHGEELVSRCGEHVVNVCLSEPWIVDTAVDGDDGAEPDAR